MWIKVTDLENLSYERYLLLSENLSRFERFYVRQQKLSFYGQFELKKNMSNSEYQIKKSEILNEVEKQIVPFKDKGMEVVLHFTKNDDNNPNIRFSDNRYQTFHGEVLSFLGEFTFTFNNVNFLVKGFPHSGGPSHACDGYLKIKSI